MKPKYGDKIKMVYTDTDSFVLHTKTDDICEDLNTIKKEIDFSDSVYGDVKKYKKCKGIAKGTVRLEICIQH